MKRTRKDRLKLQQKLWESNYFWNQNNTKEKEKTNGKTYLPQNTKRI